MTVNSGLCGLPACAPAVCEFQPDGVTHTLNQQVCLCCAVSAELVKSALLLASRIVCNPYVALTLRAYTRVGRVA